MDLNEINAILDNALATNAPSVAPTPTSAPTAGVAAPTVGLLDRSVRDLVGMAGQEFTTGLPSAVTALTQLPGAALSLAQEASTQPIRTGFLPADVGLLLGRKLSGVTSEQVAEAAPAIARGVGGVALGLAGGVGGSAAGPLGTIGGAAAGYSTGELLTQKLMESLGLVDPMTSEEKFRRFFRAGGESIGGDVAVRGLSKLAKPIITTAPKITETMATLRGPQTASEIAERVGEKVAPLVNEQALTQAMKTVPQTYGAGLTTAEVLADPKLAMLEQAVGTGKLTPELAQQYAAEVAKREDVRLGLIRSIEESSAQTPMEQGQTIRAAMQNAKAADAEVRRAAYDKIPKDEVITSWGKLKTNIAKERENLFSGGRQEPDELTKVLNDIASRKTWTPNQAQNAYSALGELAREYEIISPTFHSMAKYAQKQVRTYLLEAPATKSKVAKAWKAANKQAYAFADKWQDGPLAKILKPDQVLDENLISKITSSEKAARDYFDMIGNDPNAIKPIRAKIVDDLVTKLENNQSVANEINRNKHIYRVIFGDEVDLLTEYVADKAARTKLQKRANATYGSPTALKQQFELENALLGSKGFAAKPSELRRRMQTVAASIPTVVGTTLGATMFPGMPVLGAIGGSLGGLLGTVPILKYAARREGQLADLGEQFYQALMQPREMQKVLQASKAATQRRALGESQRAAQIAAIEANVPSAARIGGMTAPLLPNEIGAESSLPTLIEAPSITVDDIRRQMQELLGPAEAQAAVMPPEEVVKQRMIQRFPKASPEVREVLSGADELLQAIAYVESRGNPKARSPKGAIGLYQFVPGTAKSLGIDPNDPAQSLDGAKRYMDKLIGRFDSEQLALAAYNWGEGNVVSAMKQVARAKKIDDWRKVPWSTLSEFKPRGSKDYLVPPETRRYVPKVLALRESYLTRG